MKAISKLSVLAITCWLLGAVTGITILPASALAQHSAPEATNQTPALPQEEATDPLPLPRADFLALQPFLPQQIFDMKRITLGGVSSSFMGISTIFADATYTNESTGAVIYVKLSDIIGHGPLLRLAKSGWLGLSMSHQDEQGYERTIQYKGYSGFEAYDAEERRGEVTILIADRYLLELEGGAIGPGQLTKALDAFDLKALAAFVPTKMPIPSPITNAPPSERPRSPLAPASNVPSAPHPEESDTVAPIFLSPRLHAP